MGGYKCSPQAHEAKSLPDSCQGKGCQGKGCSSSPPCCTLHGTSSSFVGARSNPVCSSSCYVGARPRSTNSRACPGPTNECGPSRGRCSDTANQSQGKCSSFRLDAKPSSPYGVA